MLLDPRCIILIHASLAGTYAIASYLPPVLLDNLLVLPHLLVDVRTRLLPIPSPLADPASNRAVRSVTPASHPETVPGTGATPLALQQSAGQVSTVSKAAVISDSHPDVNEQGAVSDADVESNDGDLESTGVGSSWVSLGPRESSE